VRLRITFIDEIEDREVDDEVVKHDTLDVDDEVDD
jgi:hypothetical protein